MNKDFEGQDYQSVRLGFRPFIQFSLFLLTTLIITACQPDEDFIPEPIDDPVISIEGAGDFEQMVVEVNKLRAAGCRCGNTNMPAVGPLQWDDRLASAAAQHNLDMNQTGELNHTGSDGSTAGDRIERYGYQWRSYGENIASGFTNMDAVLQAWIDSPGHCRNIMNERFEEIGVARQGNYWTQVFASPL